MAEDPGLTAPVPSLRRELLRGGSGALALQIGSAVLSTGGAVVLARLLGVEEYGAYAFAMATVGLLVIPSTLGLPGLAVREVATYVTRGEWGELRGLVTWSTRIVAVMGSAVALAAGVILGIFGVAPDEARAAVLLALVLVPLVALIQLGSSLLRGLRQVVLGHAHETVMRPALALILVGLAYVVVGDRIDQRWAVGAQLGAAALTLAVATVLGLRCFPAAAAAATPTIMRHRWLVAAIPMMLVDASNVVMMNIDVVMVGALEDPAAAGVYRVASRGAMAVVFILIAANVVLQPVIATLWSQRDMARLQHVLTRGVRLVALGALPVAVSLILFGSSILRVVFGSEFETGSIALAILAAGQFVNAAVGSAGTVLLMTGFERATASAVGVGAVVNVVLNAALVPPFGIEGAAAATAISIVTWNLLLVRSSIRLTGIDPTVIGLLGGR